MIEQSIIIEVGGHQVLSELRYDESHPERTMIHITSSCGSHRAVNSLTIKHRMGYSPEQAAFDIEDARFRYAEALAGKKEVRSTLPALLAPARDRPRVVSCRECLRPTPK